MASSSQVVTAASIPSSAPRWKYDVFLSFRGIDTRKGITFELYDRLQNRCGIKTFMDDQDLEVGDVIYPALFTAIEESRFAIVVLSLNYASSPWCLVELAKICQCMKDNNRILPLFYHVNPSDIRYQKRSFEEAFTKHETSGRHREEVQQWRDALKKVANFSGWHTQNYKTERELVEAIVESMCSKIRPCEIEFTMSKGDFEAYEATTEAIEKVMTALKDDKVTVIGVYGMGGVGKTTIVEHVGALARNTGIFHHVIMAVVSQNPDFRKIQGTLADLLEVKLEGETDIGRASRLQKEIIRRNKVLIILDDVWEMVDLSRLGIPSYDKLQRCNSKVLLTTRRLNVCQSMESQSSIPLNILSEEDSWKLFMKKARRSFAESTTFYEIARKVARECAGLPVALTAVARALGDKDLNEWEEAARRLKASQPVHPEDGKVVLKCIKLSYDYLRSDDARSYFLLCCLFPEDYDILIEDLLGYGFGNGLFQHCSTLQEARASAHSEVKYLKASSLLLGGNHDEQVRMHDVIRDMAILIYFSEDSQRFLVKAGCELKNWPKINTQNAYSGMSLMWNDICKLPKELVCPKLQILSLRHNIDLAEIPEPFFLCSTALRVLDLSDTSIFMLPQSFSLLTNLQALYLDFCEKIIDISILGQLKKLEILSMKEYPLKELPGEIGGLTNLRKLDFSFESSRFGGVVTIPSEVISKLLRLEELYMSYCGFWHWGSIVMGEGEETNICFDEITSLPYLNILTVCISDVKCIPKTVELDPNWVYFAICISRGRRMVPSQSHNGHNVRSLILDQTMSTLPYWFVNVVTKKSEKLEYEDCRDLMNILVEHDHGILHGLKHLSVSGPCKKLQELMNTTTWGPNKPVFENLEELQLYKLDSLKKLCVGELLPGSLCNLKVLYVSSCCNLRKVLVPSKLLQRIPNLEKLICHAMPGMEYVFGCEGFEAEQSKLRVLKLLNLEAILSICNVPAPPAMFRTLRGLFLYKCKFLRHIITSDVGQCYFQLEDLFVESCPIFEGIIKAGNETVNTKKILLPELKNLVLVDLPVLYSALINSNSMMSNITTFSGKVCWKTLGKTDASEEQKKITEKRRRLIPIGSLNLRMHLLRS